MTDIRTRIETGEHRRELMARAHELDAQLSVLAMYDDQRRFYGYDYGNGQRAHELIRARRERDFAFSQAKTFGYGMGLGELHAPPQLVLDTARKISKQRLARYRRDAYCSRTGELALRAWTNVLAECERAVVAAAELGLAEVSR